MDDLVEYLRALGAAHAAGLFDLRFFIGDAVAQRFVPLGDEPRVAALVTQRSSSADAYVGALPRTRRAGDRTATPVGACVWVDLDHPYAAERLRAFIPEPSIVVRSGSPGHAHAYWLLDRLWPAAVIERANRRLAHRLNADPASTDATRVLRPPHTLNHKHYPPTPVTLERLKHDRIALADLVGHLSDPPPPIAPARSQRSSSDPLLRIPPADYVEQLTGRRPGRNGKLRCPFHDDAHPSLHVYADPARGWFCFGCRRGGSVYDLGAQVWDLGTRGRDFHELRRRLTVLFTANPPTAEVPSIEAPAHAQ